MLDSEYSALFNFTIDKNGSVVILTDITAFGSFEYQPLLFNQTFTNLINKGQIKNMNELGVYASNCVINDFDCSEIVKKLCKNGDILGYKCIFCDASETLTFPRMAINSLLVRPEVKVLCERLKLHDPRIKGK
uniref:Uncharacterized protein n=1 Tax=Panagrolaimus davidi TaxID=227884 RepID=A0A914PYY2_9BILA